MRWWIAFSLPSIPTECSYARHITIRADSGVVTLGGYVWSPEDLVQAKDDAQAVPGVTKVVDRMEVDRGAVSDSAVTR